MIGRLSVILDINGCIKPAIVVVMGADPLQRGSPVTILAASAVNYPLGIYIVTISSRHMEKPLELSYPKLSCAITNSLVLYLDLFEPYDGDLGALHR